MENRFKRQRSHVGNNWLTLIPIDRNLTETVVGTTSPTNRTPPVTTTEPVAFELATSDTWLQTLSILGTVAYTTGLTLSSQDGLILDVSQTGDSHSTLNSESSSTFDLSTETTHADQTVTTALYQVQSTLAYSASDNEQSALQSALSISSDDEVTTSGTLLESGDGISSGTSTTIGSHESSTVQPATDPNGALILLQTSNDIWTDHLTFDDLYEFDLTAIFSEDGSFIVNLQQSGSGASAFDHISSGSSDDADEATPTETYQHHIWENTDYSYAVSATIASIPAESDSSSSDSSDPQAYSANTDGSGSDLVSLDFQMTDFSYASTTQNTGGADLNGTSEFAKSLIGTLPITNAETLSNAPASANVPWNDTMNQELGMENLDELDEGMMQFVATTAAPKSEADQASEVIKEFLAELEDELWEEHKIKPGDGGYGNELSKLLDSRLDELNERLKKKNLGKVETGVLVGIAENNQGLYLDKGVKRGTEFAAEIDLMYYMKGYTPKPEKVLNRQKIIAIEIKASRSGTPSPEQLLRYFTAVGEDSVRLYTSKNRLMFVEPWYYLVERTGSNGGKIRKWARNKGKFIPIAALVGVEVYVLLTFDSTTYADECRKELRGMQRTDRTNPEHFLYASGALDAYYLWVSAALSSIDEVDVARMGWYYAIGQAANATWGKQGYMRLKPSSFEWLMGRDPNMWYFKLLEMREAVRE